MFCFNASHYRLLHTVYILYRSRPWRHITGNLELENSLCDGQAETAQNLGLNLTNRKMTKFPERSATWLGFTFCCRTAVCIRQSLTFRYEKGLLAL